MSCLKLTDRTVSKKFTKLFKINLKLTDRTKNRQFTKLSKLCNFWQIAQKLKNSLNYLNFVIFDRSDKIWKKPFKLPKHLNFILHNKSKYKSKTTLNYSINKIRSYIKIKINWTFDKTHCKCHFSFHFAHKLKIQIYCDGIKAQVLRTIWTLSDFFVND